eukprot:8596004-Pyramimonas_sp.AAC.1
MARSVVLTVTICSCRYARVKVPQRVRSSLYSRRSCPLGCFSRGTMVTSSTFSTVGHTSATTARPASYTASRERRTSVAP